MTLIRVPYRGGKMHGIQALPVSEYQLEAEHGRCSWVGKDGEGGWWECYRLKKLKHGWAHVFIGRVEKLGEVPVKG